MQTFIETLPESLLRHGGRELPIGTTKHCTVHLNVSQNATAGKGKVPIYAQPITPRAAAADDPPAPVGNKTRTLATYAMKADQQSPRPKKETPGVAPGRPYAKPRLSSYGELRTLTMGFSPGENDSNDPFNFEFTS